MSNVNIGKIISINESEPRKFQVGDKVHYDIGDGKLRDGEVRSYNEKTGEFSILRKYKNTIFIDIAKAEMMSHIPDPDKVIHITRAGASGAIAATPFVSVEAFPFTAIAALKLKPVEREEVYLTTPEIIDGAGTNSLKESIKVFKLATGDIVVAASDKGINYKTYDPHNEDRVAIIPKNNGILVADGMGGHNNGEKVAIALADEIVKTPNNIKEATDNTQKRMKEESLGNGGVCYIYSQIIENDKGEKYLNLFQAGDVHAVVYDKNGKILFESKDESSVQELVDGGMDPDKALYHPDKSEVTNALLEDSNRITIRQFGPLPKGAIVTIYTDGIGDNLTPDEIWDKIKGKSPRDAVNIISDVTSERMKNYWTIIKATSSRFLSGRYSDKYKTKPKPDNRGLAIIYIQ